MKLKCMDATVRVCSTGRRVCMCAAIGVLSMFICLWILDAYTSMKLRCTYMPMKQRKSPPPKKQTNKQTN